MGSIPGTLANIIRGSVLLVAGILTDSEDAISLGRQIASGNDNGPKSRGPSPQELDEMKVEIERWKADLDLTKRGAGSRSDTAELQEILARREEELRDFEAKYRQIEDDVKNYPMPQYFAESGYQGTVNIAVVGNSGVGKSLLINSIRGVKNGDPTWAPVGVNQTTREPTMYEFPGQRDTRIWDLAGAGAQHFPRGSYTRCIGLRYFDLVLVVTTCRFTQTEVVLLKELDEHNRKSFVVRTMVDVDITSNSVDHGQPESETKGGIMQDLRDRGVAEPYLINARKPEEHDFPKLIKDVLSAIEESRRLPWEKPWEKPWDAKSPVSQLSLKIEQYEVGEIAEIWSAQFQLWVKCIIHSKGSTPDEYNILVPTAPPDRRQKSNIPAETLRKAVSFEVGEAVEVVVLQGPQAGTWVKCTISRRTEKQDTYDIYVPAAPFGKRSIANVHCSALRKDLIGDLGQSRKTLQDDVDTVKELLQEFKSVCAKKDFQATISSLGSVGESSEFSSMKRTFIAHQLNPTMIKFGLPASKEGWKDLLEFVRSQEKDAEVVKLGHEIERLLSICLGDFFGVKPTVAEKALDTVSWRQRIKGFVLGFFRSQRQLGDVRAQAAAATGAPMSRNQGTVSMKDPFSKALAAPSTFFPQQR